MLPLLVPIAVALGLAAVSEEAKKRPVWTVDIADDVFDRLGADGINGPDGWLIVDFDNRVVAAETTRPPRQPAGVSRWYFKRRVKTKISGADLNKWFTDNAYEDFELLRARLEDDPEHWEYVVDKAEECIGLVIDQVDWIREVVTAAEYLDKLKRHSDSGATILSIFEKGLEGFFDGAKEDMYVLTGTENEKRDAVAAFVKGYILTEPWTARVRRATFEEEEPRRLLGEKSTGLFVLVDREDTDDETIADIANWFKMEPLESLREDQAAFVLWVC